MTEYTVHPLKSCYNNTHFEQKATASVNADLMTADEIHTNLQSGLKDAEMGRVQDAQRILWRT